MTYCNKIPCKFVRRGRCQSCCLISLLFSSISCLVLDFGSSLWPDQTDRADVEGAQCRPGSRDWAEVLHGAPAVSTRHWHRLSQTITERFPSRFSAKMVTPTASTIRGAGAAQPLAALLLPGHGLFSKDDCYPARSTNVENSHKQVTKLWPPLNRKAHDPEAGFPANYLKGLAETTPKPDVGHLKAPPGQPSNSTPVPKKYRNRKPQPQPGTNTPSTPR
jgi:hypothetical protein